MKNICGQDTMRTMDENFNEETCIRTLGILSGHEDLEEMPHYDTLNYYLEKLEPSCLEQFLKNTSSMLLESFRQKIVTDEDGSYTMRYTTIYLE